MAVDSWEALFRLADQDNDGQVGGQEAISFFSRTGLPQNVLADIWLHSDTNKCGFLWRPEFFIALQLATVAQAGGQVNEDVARAVKSGSLGRVPLPKLAGLELVRTAPSPGSQHVRTGSMNLNSSGIGSPSGPVGPGAGVLAGVGAHFGGNAVALSRAGSSRLLVGRRDSIRSIGPGIIPAVIPDAGGSYSPRTGWPGEVVPGAMPSRDWQGRQEHGMITPPAMVSEGIAERRGVAVQHMQMMPPMQQGPRAPVEGQRGVMNRVGGFPGRADSQVHPSDPKQLAHVRWDDADKVATAKFVSGANVSDPFGDPPFRATGSQGPETSANGTGDHRRGDMQPPPTMMMAGGSPPAVPAAGARGCKLSSSSTLNIAPTGGVSCIGQSPAAIGDGSSLRVTPGGGTDISTVDNPFGGDTFTALPLSASASSEVDDDKNDHREVGMIKDKTVGGGGTFVATTQKFSSVNQCKHDRQVVAMEPRPEGSGSTWPTTNLTAASSFARRQPGLNTHKGMHTNLAPSSLTAGYELVPFVPAAPAAAAAPGNQTVSPCDWPQITPTDVQRYSAMFMNADVNGDGVISGQETRDVFMGSQVPQEVLQQVWNLSLEQNNSNLSLREFCIALYFVERIREGWQLPQVLPPGLRHFDVPFHSHEQFVASRAVETQSGSRETGAINNIHAPTVTELPLSPQRSGLGLGATGPALGTWSSNSSVFEGFPMVPRGSSPVPCAGASSQLEVSDVSASASAVPRSPGKGDDTQLLNSEPGKGDGNQLLNSEPVQKVSESEAPSSSASPGDGSTTTSGRPGYKSQAPVLDMNVVEQLSRDDREALLTRLKEAEELGRQVWETEMELLDAKRKIECQWSKLQDVIVFNNRYSNQLSEMEALVRAEKSEVAMLAKMYDDKFQKTETATSRLQAEEAALRDLYVKKAQLRSATFRLRHLTDESTSSLQTRTDDLVTDLDATRKAAVTRSKSFGLCVPPASEELGLSSTWETSKMENIIEWDDDWTDFKDEGFMAPEETTLESPNTVLVPSLMEDLISFDSSDDVAASESEEDTTPPFDWVEKGTTEPERTGDDAVDRSTSSEDKTEPEITGDAVDASVSSKQAKTGVGGAEKSIYSWLQDLYESSSSTPAAKGKKEDEDISNSIASLCLGSPSNIWKSLSSSPVRQKPDAMDFSKLSHLGCSIPIASVGPGSTG